MGGRNQYSFQKGNQIRGNRKGIPNKVPGSFKASIRQICHELSAKEHAEIRTSFLRGLKAEPPYSAPYFRMAAEYVDGKPTGPGEGPPPGSFFQILLRKPVTEDPLAYRYEPQKALEPEGATMVVLPDEPEAPQEGKAVRRRAKGDGRLR